MPPSHILSLVLTHPTTGQHNTFTSSSATVEGAFRIPHFFHPSPENSNHHHTKLSISST